MERGTNQAAPAAFEDVGPAKPAGRPRRLLQLACTLVVILAGLLVVTEVTGATRIIGSLASLLRSQERYSHLIVHVTDQSVQFSIDGSVQLRGPGYFDYSFPGKRSGFVVETFKAGRKVSGMHFSASPGLSIELEISSDGQILVEHDGPIRSPRPRESVLRSLAKMREGAAEKIPIPLEKLPLQAELPGCAGSNILEYSPDGRYLIVAGNAGSQAVPELVLYDRQTGWNGRFIWKGDGPRCLVFTRDSKVFITGADDGTIQVWDTSSFVGQSPTENLGFPEPIADINYGHKAVSSLAISPDGRLLASGSVKGELAIRQWRPSENTVQQFNDNSPPQRVVEVRRGAAISSLSFSPDERRWL